MLRRSKRHGHDGHRSILAVLLCLSGLGAFIVSSGNSAVPEGGKDDEKVYLLHSDELYYDAHGKNPDAQIVKGNVSFLHKGGHLTCDSAYFYEERNSVRTMGHVHYWEGDTLSLVCERGYYDGQKEMMEARENVVLVHQQQTLYTDSLNYDRLWLNAYFYDGGKLIDGGQQLVSDWGTYNTGTKSAVFYYNVVLLGQGRRVETDTLYYDTNTSLSHVVGPSTVYQDSTIVHTSDGYFERDSEFSRLYGRSVVEKGEKTITGDSLFYNKETGDAFGFGDVIYTDRENMNEMRGEYMQYNEQTGYGYTTERALVKDYSQGPDTLYMHGDTIKLFTFNIGTDSVYRLVHCYNNVRAYREDMQAICDSLVGDSRDSCMTMYQDPVVWNEERQVLGEVIKVYTNDSTLREVHVIDQALSVEKCDEEEHYNQVSSRLMDTYYVDGKARRTDAIGNVKSIYYPVDDTDSSLMLLNYTETDTLRIYISPESQLEKIWTCKHVSDMYPMTQIPPDKYKLEQFAWHEELRPKDKDDIFVHKRMNDEAKLKKQERIEVPLQSLPPGAVGEDETAVEDTVAREDVPVAETAAGESENAAETAVEIPDGGEEDIPGVDTAAGDSENAPETVVEIPDGGEEDGAVAEKAVGDGEDAAETAVEVPAGDAEAAREDGPTAPGDETVRAEAESAPSGEENARTEEGKEQ